LICTDAFFGLDVKRLITLKIVSAALGIGGEIAPIAPPGYAPDNCCFWARATVLSCYRNW